ncbi:ABC-2 type transport system ATP-binding protein [Alkalithermobacter thermoalcaliphilus JW-YL-7 = DSM 7308]|uniref:ABC-2 type transport system ATP-binding protein n=1 Tax=Alkalithermobacter thermoalcaliphilus JW-YL-7 = DSM 7308 TaxID=1121328 RepID=A0A150FN35_CLOPD|nr:Sulfate-transporting ATPase [[Clostridium] paradoxum JW-YL-7 = DSM 7308]SHL04687.1 ABC-2 type transport system ATP-binding protein [[Clostridium] paradoxum JW-YL-7 = DSM 7308]
MLILNNVSKSYDKSKKAVDNISLEINKGEIVGFIGPNGAGKTTTIKMITGMISPDSGKISINGLDITKDPVEAKKNFTFVPDHPTIFDSIKGIDYLNFIADMYDVSINDRKKRIEKFTKTFQIYDALTKTINSYSHGMRQKLLISGALLPNPKLFILDEPLVGLDPHSAKILKDLMKDHCKNGGTVFFSSHLLEVVENLCDKVAIIHKGRLIAYDTAENIKSKSNSTLEEIFLEMTKDE